MNGSGRGPPTNHAPAAINRHDREINGCFTHPCIGDVAIPGCLTAIGTESPARLGQACQGCRECVLGGRNDSSVSEASLTIRPSRLPGRPFSQGAAYGTA
jgi:hypothetical protein